jgi:hypothetical protein
VISFEQWAFIADCYTPILVAVSIYVAFTQALTAEQRKQFHWLPVSFCLVALYVVRFGDELLNIWPSFGSDYSTHTAFALVFVLHQTLNSSRLKWLAPLSLMGYMQLMHHQNYHTYLDMLSTTLFLAPIFAFIWVKARTVK